MNGNKYRQGIGNSDIASFKNVIQDIAKSEINKYGFPTYKAAVVQKVNDDGTVDVYLPPNKENLVTKVLNKCGELLMVDDSVEIATKNGSLTNCWVAIKHGTIVQGHQEEVEKLSGEVVMKVQNGRLSVAELQKDASLGNSFTIIADDINLDGMNIVLNGSRGITISSPYFNVTKEGYITATGGTIGGWSMGATRLYSGSGSNYVALDSGTNGVNYPIWAGNEDATKAPFSVTREGVIKATSGTIGGFTLTSGRLYSGSGATTAGIGVYGGDLAFWAGSNDSSSAPFRVGHGGSLVATNANISGTISTGNITATGGRIGGYTISGAQLIGNNVGLSGQSGQGWAFWAGSNDSGSAPFRVGHDGSFYATSGSISGGMVSSGINASNITGGTMSANRISGGTLSISTSGGGNFTVGTNGRKNAYASGLTVGGDGIDCSAAGIRAYRFICDQGGAQYSGSDADIQIYDGHGKVWYLSFQGGILYATEYK